jgi:galactose-1-phosphate uridylyltransferase
MPVWAKSKSLSQKKKQRKPNLSKKGLEVWLLPNKYEALSSNPRIRPVILATQEAEIRRILVEASPGK